MEIILGKTAGFCYGVERAVKEALSEAKKSKKLYCLGEIVHNKNVVDNLRSKGIVFIEKIEEAKETAIIRAHGVGKDVYKKAQDLNIKLIDLTCPSVLKIHEIAEEYAEKKYYIILTGKKSHPEVIGIESFCGEKYCIIEKMEELKEKMDYIVKEENILLISQTTYNSTKFNEIANYLKENITTNLIVKKTICASTEIRQKETDEISKKVDIMIIIGDKKSSNTNKLYEISCKNCSKVMFVENVNEIEFNKIDKTDKIGIMAGASTPKEDIETIYNALKSI